MIWLTCSCTVCRISAGIVYILYIIYVNNNNNTLGKKTSLWISVLKSFKVYSYLAFYFICCCLLHHLLQSVLLIYYNRNLVGMKTIDYMELEKKTKRMILVLLRFWLIVLLSVVPTHRFVVNISQLNQISFG